MKKVLISMMLLLALTTSVQAASQKHRHHASQELVDTAQASAIEVFSDTTDTAQTVVPVMADDMDDENIDELVGNAIGHAISSMDGKDVAGVLLVLGIVLFIFVFVPLLIILIIFYFIHRNRREKQRLAQAAMQQGQPNPEQLLIEDKVNNVTDDYQKGMRQCFVGIGLAIFFGYAAGEIGFGLGALIFFIGLGKVIAAKTSKKQ